MAGELAEGELDVGAGGVAAGVDDAGARVGCFPPQRHHAIDAVEGHAEAHEVGDAVGGLVREDVGRFGVDEAGAGADRVLVVQLGAIVGADRGRDAALGVLRVGLVDAALGEDEDAAVLARHEGRVEPGDARAHDDVVEMTRHVCVLPPPDGPRLPLHLETELKLRPYMLLSVEVTLSRRSCYRRAYGVSIKSVGYLTPNPSPTSERGISPYCLRMLGSRLVVALALAVLRSPHGVAET